MILTFAITALGFWKFAHFDRRDIDVKGTKLIVII